MKDTPISYNVVKAKIEESGLPIIGRGTIRDIVRLVNKIESATGEKYVRMEMGIPGLNTPQIGINAEIESIKRGVTSKYPMLEGIPEFSNEAARFVKLFMNIDVKPACCIPTTGTLQGSYASFITIDNMYEDRDTTLFIDPGFPVHKQQITVARQKMESFDVYNYRGNKLRDKLESYFKNGNIHSVLYSNPNNPTWICFTEKELQIIGELANKYNVIVLEDLAYFGMDFRKDFSKPGKPPYQPTVANYTENYILLISTSKIFSYPGQRVGILILSNKLLDLKAPALKRYYSSDVFGYVLLYGTLYAISAGASHSPQYGIAAILKAINNGDYNFRDDVIEYGKKAKIMKRLFIENGFEIVYDKDEEDDIADGFFFTISYPGFSGVELLEELLYYGISAISLIITRSELNHGLRACVSLVKRSQFTVLEYRLKKFHEHHPIDRTEKYNST